MIFKSILSVLAGLLYLYVIWTLATWLDFKKYENGD